MTTTHKIQFCFLVHFIYLLLCSIATKRWLSVKGEIVQSKLNVTKNMGEELMTSYKANVKYQYIVGEKEYLSGRIFYGDYIERNFSAKPDKAIKKYIDGEQVLVHYNSTNHGCSVLENGINPVIYRELCIGILFLTLSVFMVIKESFFISMFG